MEETLIIITDPCFECGMCRCHLCNRCHYCIKGLCPPAWEQHQADIAKLKEQGLQVHTNWTLAKGE